MNKQIVGRVQHKHDVEANWLKAENFIPLEGELIIYDPDENHESPRFKVGDGDTLISALPFAHGEANIGGTVFEGATENDDGTSGYVPSPSAGDQDKYLCGDGTWSRIRALTSDTSDTSDELESLPTNADMLGGVYASEYVLKSELNDGTAFEALKSHPDEESEEELPIVKPLPANADMLGGIYADQYVTKDELNELDLKFDTSILDSYATKEYVDQAIANIQRGSGVAF